MSDSLVTQDISSRNRTGNGNKTKKTMVIPNLSPERKMIIQRGGRVRGANPRERHPRVIDERFSSGFKMNPWSEVSHRIEPYKEHRK